MGSKEYKVIYHKFFKKIRKCPQSKFLNPKIKILGQICSFLELTNSVRSPLGSRKALQNRFAEQTGWFQKFITPVRHVFSKLLFPKGEFLKELYRGVPLVEWLSLPLLIPQRRVPLRNDSRGLIGLSALFTLYYPPKESSLSPRGPIG